MNYNYPYSTKDLKIIKVLLRLLNGEEISLKDIEEDLCICNRMAKKIIQTIREALYDIYGDDAVIIYDRINKVYYLVLLKSRFNISNLPLF